MKNRINHCLTIVFVILLLSSSLVVLAPTYSIADNSSDDEHKKGIKDFNNDDDKEKQCEPGEDDKYEHECDNTNVLFFKDDSSSSIGRTQIGSSITVNDLSLPGVVQLTIMQIKTSLDPIFLKIIH